jgi:anionic cell wall polymer biosynthesis LytR-Cps2A-Psr (LCP) family protein
VEGLTGHKIQFAGLITFTGVIEMSNAVGGVPVCVAGNIDDPEVGLHLKAGTRTLKGYTALKFLRSRHGVGDGSDLGRISSQQVYLSALVRKLKDNNTLSDVQTLYKIASAATKNMQLSTSLASVDTMFAIAQALKNIPLDRVVFVQYPGTTGQGGIYSGKVAPIPSVADELFRYIRADKPFKVGVGGNNRGSVKDPHAPHAGTTPTKAPSASGTTPTATKKPGKVGTINGLVGQSASDYTCSRAYGH